eukprot:3203031-Pyramimonas_sp.AAC.1
MLRATRVDAKGYSVDAKGYTCGVAAAEDFLQHASVVVPEHRAHLRIKSTPARTSVCSAGASRAIAVNMSCVRSQSSDTRGNIPAVRANHHLRHTATPLRAPGVAGGLEGASYYHSTGSELSPASLASERAHLL